MVNRDETQLVDITEAVVPVDHLESVNVTKAVELIKAKVQATDTEVNDGFRCNIEKERTDAVPSTCNLSINFQSIIV